MTVLSIMMMLSFKRVLIDKDVDYDASNADMNGDGKITITV